MSFGGILTMWFYQGSFLYHIMEDINPFNDLRKQVLDIKCSVLRDYLTDLEGMLKNKNSGFASASQLENKEQDAPVDLEDAAIKGVNDWLYRNPINYLESEIKKTKYDYSIALAELLSLSGNITEAPQSKYDIDKIKEIPILDLISQFTVIRNNNQAICPIHREKTPSLYIYESTNSWFCFGHGSGGSVIDFMMQLNNYSITEALDDLMKML